MLRKPADQDAGLRSKQGHLNWRHLGDARQSLCKTRCRRQLPSEATAKKTCSIRAHTLKDGGQRQTKKNRASECVSKILEGLRGDAFSIAQDIGLNRLLRPNGIDHLIEQIRQQAFPLQSEEASELFRQGQLLSGPLAKQPGEPMLLYIARRKRWWSTLCMRTNLFGGTFSNSSTQAHGYMAMKSSSTKSGKGSGVMAPRMRRSTASVAMRNSPPPGSSTLFTFDQHRGLTYERVVHTYPGCAMGTERKVSFQEPCRFPCVGSRILRRDRFRTHRGYAQGAPAE